MRKEIGKKLTVDGNIGRFAHVVAAIEPVKQFSFLWDDEYSGRDTVNSYNLSTAGDSESSNDVNVSERSKNVLFYNK